MKQTKRNDLHTLRGLVPYLWAYKGRVLLALGCLILAKLAIVTVPLLLKQIVDSLDSSQNPIIFLPLSLMLGYGALRIANVLFGELRDAIFAKVTQHSVRMVALKVFRHLHNLSMQFHLNRQTGGVSRDIERGTRGISFLLNFMVFNILPTLIEISLIAIILFINFNIWFALIPFITAVIYIAFTLIITEWRMKFRREMNDMDSKANTRAIDSLLNFETVKYFSNEDYETRRYDENMKVWEVAAIRSQTSLASLNVGQGVIIAISITLLMYMAGKGVENGEMTLGDLVMVNTYLIQMFIPMNFLGFVYRQIKHSLVDMEKMFNLLDENMDIKDKDDAKPLALNKGEIRFDHVNFSYTESREILKDVSFTIPAGKKVAVVGTSGSGKSTLVRLLFRFYDTNAGSISIDGQDIRDITQDSLRQVIGIVPQDTVLFNDSIYYNIAYAKPDAPREDVIKAADMAHLTTFIDSLPDGFDTLVGERGLKVSGGEKQRIAIARAILKDTPILVFDEATSALDSKSEQQILKALETVAANHTTLVIAHRLSTIVDADVILVMEEGRIIEQGSHQTLLQQGNHYAHMWQLQQENKTPSGTPSPGSKPD